MATSYLTNLPVEVQCQILDLVLCPNEENVIENPIFDQRIFDTSPPLVNTPTTLLDVSILDTCKSLRAIGFHILYAKNTVRFTSPHDARNFICHPKARDHQRLIKYLELEIDVFGLYLDSWVNFFRGNFMQDFRVKRLDIHFPYGPPRAGGWYLIAEDHSEFVKIQQALVDKIRVDNTTVSEVCVTGLTSDGYDAGCYLVDAMYGLFDGAPTKEQETGADDAISEGMADMLALVVPDATSQWW